MIRFGWAALLAVLAGGPAVAATAFDQTDISVPTKEADGTAVQLSGRLCLPQGAVRPRVMLFNHGKLDDPRGAVLKTCDTEQAQWFLGRGFAVTYIHRRGNGKSGGSLAENTSCLRTNWAVQDALEGTRDIEASVAYLASLPQLRHDGMVVQGHSAGGWAAIGFDALRDPRVVALLNFAGGRKCRNAGEIAAAAASFGALSPTPMLWIYTANDVWFPPEDVQAFYKGYIRGGGKANLHALPRYGSTQMDGHMFWQGDGATAIWGPIVEAYLKERGVMGADGKAAP